MPWGPVGTQRGHVGRPCHSHPVGGRLPGARDDGATLDFYHAVSHLDTANAAHPHHGNGTDQRSVEPFDAIENGVLGMHAGSHHSGRGQCGAGKYQARPAIGGQTPAESSTFA
jgi:hypothetical protein